MISIKDHGAIPDPTADNTAFIQAALDAALVSSETRTVVAPPGFWGTSRVDVPEGVTLWSDGGTLKHLVMDADEPCVALTGADATVRDLAIDGNRANQTRKGYGILALADRANIEKVKVYETTGTGVQVSGRSGHRLEKVHVYDTDENGIGFTVPTSGIEATDFTIYGALIERTLNGGIGVLGKNFSVTSCTTRDTMGDGLTAYSDKNGYYSLIGNNIYGVGNNGIHSAGPGATLTGNTIYDCIHRGVYHLSDSLLTQEGVIISSNYVRGTGLDGYEVWPSKALTMLGNVMIDSQQAAYHIRQADGLAMSGNVAQMITGDAFRFGSVRNISGAGNVGTNIGGDLVRVDDGELPPSLNGVFAATVGNATSSAMNFRDGGWFHEIATMPGATGAAPYFMGAPTNRRLIP